MKFLWLLVAFSWSALADQKGPYYRVIHASPNEFVSALRTPLTTGSSELRSSLSAGRLAQLLPITRKSWNGKELRLEIRPLLPDVFFSAADRGLVHLCLSDLPIGFQEDYRFKVDLELGQRSVHGMMSVEKHESGSLLVFWLHESNYPDWAMAAFAKAATALNFVSLEKPLMPQSKK